MLPLGHLDLMRKQFDTMMKLKDKYKRDEIKDFRVDI